MKQAAGVLGALVALAPCASGCGGSEDEAPPPVSRVADDLIDGVAAGDEYEAVGALVATLPDGTLFPFCTGTLVERDVVLTAKHCLVSVPPGLRVSFALGADAAHPHTLVPEASQHSRDWENTVPGGAMALGSDVAVLHLAESVRFVRPLRVGVLSEDDLGKGFDMVGYGLESSPEDGKPPAAGRRRRGDFPLRALGGRVFELEYGSFEAFFAVAKSALPPEVTSAPDFEAQARAVYDGQVLLPGYEAYLGRESSPPFVCNGDSGGPILRRDRAGRLTVYGVASGHVAFDPSCRRGAIWAVVGPKTQEFLAASARCRELANGGTCERTKLGSAAVTCGAGAEHRGGEASPRPVVDRCDSKTESCADTPTGALCAPKCKGDEDCAKLAPGGVCDVPSGTCSFTRSCTAELPYLACSLCCDAAYPSQADACKQACAAAQAGGVATKLSFVAPLPGWPDVRPRGGR